MNKCFQKSGRYAFFAILLFLPGLLRAEPGVSPPDFDLRVEHYDKGTRLHPKLAEKRHQLKRKNSSRIHSAGNSIKNKVNHLILVDAISKGDPEDLLNDLLALGLQSAAVNGRIISGQLPLESLEKLDYLQSLNEIKSSGIITSQGSVVTQGDSSQKSDIARQNFNVDGSGITVGVISDSYDCLGGAAADRLSNDLPESAISIEEALDCDGKTDEGRALMQIIHDIAPGAHLVFHSGANGLARTANAILDLEFKFDVDIIVDDVKTISANFFQEGPISQAIAKVVKAGVVYVTAAGNSGRSSYQSIYNEHVNTALQLNAHDFDPDEGVDIFQRIHVPEGAGFNLLLQWDSPAYSIGGKPGAQTDLDIFIFNESHTKILASSAFGNIGRDPVEFLQFSNPKGSGENRFDIMITKASGKSPVLLKYIILNSFEGIIQEFKTDSSGIFGHANSEFAITTGAANHLETPVYGAPFPLLQYFSSAGGTPLMMDLNGNAFASPIIPKKPDIVAPDNVSTTFFGRINEEDGKPYMSGTSAAAPHAAGVVALLLQTNPELQPADIKKILQDTAIDILQRNNEERTSTGSGFDFDSGHGLIDAKAAVDLATDFPATAPVSYEGENTDKIIVNDPEQSGGGGVFGLLGLVFLIIRQVVKKHFGKHREDQKIRGSRLAVPGIFEVISKAPWITHRPRL